MSRFSSICFALQAKQPEQVAVNEIVEVQSPGTPISEETAMDIEKIAAHISEYTQEVIFLQMMNSFGNFR